MRLDDYSVLKEMFLADVHHRRFVPTADGGFNAIDMRVMDEALVSLEQKLKELERSGSEVATIEFARSDYRQALANFSREFLESNCFVLFLDAPVETCLSRVHYRVAHQQTADDHPSFPDEKFRSYYGGGADYEAYLRTGFAQDHPFIGTECIDTQAITLEQLYERLEALVERLLQHSAAEPMRHVR